MSAAAESASEWEAFAQDARISFLDDLPTELTSLDLTKMAERAVLDRVGTLAALRRAGISKLAQRQAIANALSRWQRTSSGTVPLQVREYVPLIVSINVHESPGFLLRQLQHVSQHLPCQHRVVLNCAPRAQPS